jgi:hypothetical protein
MAQVSSILKHNVANKYLNRRCSSGPNKQAFYLYVASLATVMFAFSQRLPAAFLSPNFRIQRCACKESVSEWPCLYDVYFPHYPAHG